MAAKVNQAVANTLGIRGQGAKENKALYVLCHTKSPAILIEVYFVTSQGDAAAIQKKLAETGKKR